MIKPRLEDMNSDLWPGEHADTSLGIRQTTLPHPQILAQMGHYGKRPEHTCPKCRGEDAMQNYSASFPKLPNQKADPSPTGVMS